MLDKLDTLRIFCAAAQTLKFREAATQLGLAPQQVTRGIAELEKQLGEMLFMRNTRQIKRKRRLSTVWQILIFLRG